VCSEAADYGTGAFAVWHLCIAWLALDYGAPKQIHT